MRLGSHPFLPQLLALVRQLETVIHAAGRGTLGILYYDFRDAARRGDGKAQFSWWFVHSDNGGRTWHEQRLSRPSDFYSAPNTVVGHFIGD